MEGPNRCDLGKKNNKEKFYHWDVGNKDSIAKFKENLKKIWMSTSIGLELCYMMY
jgi:hypothetical protein